MPRTRYIARPNGPIDKERQRMYDDDLAEAERLIDQLGASWDGDILKAARVMWAVQRHIKSARRGLGEMLESREHYDD